MVLFMYESESSPEVSKHYHFLSPVKELRHKLKRPHFPKNEHFQSLLISLGKNMFHVSKQGPL